MTQMKSITSLDDLGADPANANKGTDKGRALVAQSLLECGAGRSILADKDGTVIAGNKTLEAARKLGLPVRVVESTGEELVVVRRTDLDLGTGLTAILPTWTAADGALYRTLADPAVRAKVRSELEASQRYGTSTGMGLETRDGPHGIMPLGFRLPEHEQYVGMRLDEIADVRGQDWIEAVLDLLVAEKQRIGTIYFSMDEANLDLQVPLPWVKFSSDAGGFDPAWAKAEGPLHPRAYGTFPRAIRRYAREKRLITLEDAVRKMSSSVADRLGITDRGSLREGMKADVIVFDPATITDHATFEDPHQLASGVSHVWVNGTLVVEDGTHTGATPGRFVKGQGAQ